MTARALLCVAVVFWFALPAWSQTGGQTAPSSAAPDQLVVQFAPDVVDSSLADLRPGESLGARISRRPQIAALHRTLRVMRMSPVFRARGRPARSAASARRADARRRFFVVQLEPGANLLESLSRYAAEPGVTSAQLNYVYTPDLVPNDPQYSQQYSHQKTQAAAGWNIETGDPSIAIAMVGTGVDTTHPDLAANLWVNPGEIPGNAIDDDGNGFVDDRLGWDFTENDPNPAPTDPHETQVSGVAAAVTNNAVGVAGVAWSCRIMALRIFYTSAQVAQAVDYAADNGARVINMSFGNYDVTKYGPDTIVESALDDAFAAGIVLVATVGNDSIATKRYPGALPNVISVAATTSTDARASFSNYGSWVTLAAPGDDILSTTPGGGYLSVDGTSFAAPYVSGLAALLLSKDPSLSPTSVRRRIEFSVDKITPDHFIGTGRVNVFKALSLNADPDLFAVIRSPLTSTLAQTHMTVTGTALGTDYVLEYRLSGAPTWTVAGSGASVIDGVLGTIDFTTAAPGIYSVRLTAHRGSASDSAEISVIVGAAMLEGWPQAVPSPIYSSAAVADVDGDGDLEVFATDSSSRVSGWHHDGAPVAGWPRSALGAVNGGGPAIGDIDGDGDPEIVQATESGDGYVWAWHHDGTFVTGFPRPATPSPASVHDSVVLADLDGDGVNEIIFQAHVIAGTTGLLHAWRASGGESPGFPVATEFNVQSSPAVGDIDGDGAPEIVVHGYTTLVAVHRDGTAVTGWPILFASNHTAPLLADADGDGTLDVIAIGSTSIQVRRGNGTLFASAQFPLGPPPIYALFAYSDAALGDLTGDGRPELCVGTDDGRVYVMSLSLVALPGFPATAGGDVTACAFADVDGDGRQEVISASSDGILRAFERDGSVVQGWPKVLPNVFYAAPALADLDGDGKLDLMIGDLGGNFSALALGARSYPNASHWPMVHGSAAHTGAYAVTPLCGNFNQDARIDSLDFALLRAYLADPVGAALSPEAQSRCGVIPSTYPCSILDLVVAQRAVAHGPPGVAEVCPASNP